MDDISKEILDRVRRIETRFTRYLIQRGFDTGAEGPKMVGGFISIPSPDCRLKDILDVIPHHLRHEPIDVFVGPDHIATMRKGDYDA